MYKTITNANNPLYFVRSGSIYTAQGELRYAGWYNLSWSGTTSSQYHSGATAPSAYYLRFNTETTGTSTGPSYRYYGYPLR